MMHKKATSSQIYITIKKPLSFPKRKLNGF